MNSIRGTLKSWLLCQSMNLPEGQEFRCQRFRRPNKSPRYLLNFCTWSVRTMIFTTNAHSRMGVSDRHGHIGERHINFCKEGRRHKLLHDRGKDPSDLCRVRNPVGQLHFWSQGSKRVRLILRDEEPDVWRSLTNSQTSGVGPACGSPWVRCQL